MGNINNLAPFNPNITKEQRREWASKAGKASAEAQKKRKKLKETLLVLLSSDVKGKKQKKMLKELGFNDDELNNQSLLTASLFKKAMNGSVKAFEIIRDTIGEKPEVKAEIEIPPVIMVNSIPRKEEEKDEKNKNKNKN